LSIKHHLKRLHQDKENNNLVIFIGAGISANYSNVKFPNWSELIDALSIGGNSSDPLQIAQIYQDNYSKYGLFKKVKEIFPKDYSPEDEPYKSILKLNPAHILTTNYENLIEKAVEESGYSQKYHIVDKDEDLPLANEKQKLLVKVHGSFDSENIVLSEEDYSEYEKNYPLILSFIRYIFSRHRVLFLGFSLSDPNFNRILYNVKNILKDESLEHTVILHSDISEEEKNYFLSKKVYPITSKEIISELKEASKNNYLTATLKQINLYQKEDYNQNDFLEEFLKIKKRFDILNFYMPTTIDKMFANSNLKPFISFVNIIATNIAYKNNYIGNNIDILGFYKNGFKNREDNKFKIYFDNYRELMLKSNSLYLGGVQKQKNNNQGNYIDLKFAEDLLNSSDKEEFYSLPTYNIRLEDSYIYFDYIDKIFENGSRYFSTLTLDSDSFFVNYLLKNRREVLDSFEKTTNIDKNDIYRYYLHSFKLSYLTKIIIKSKNDMEKFIKFQNIYRDIFNNFTQSEQNFFSEIDNLEFAQEFKNYLFDFESNPNKYIADENSIFGEGIFDISKRISFYVNYSSFLKFIFLNELPIFDLVQIRDIIKGANRVIFTLFINNFESNESFFPNWFIFSIALGEMEDIRLLVTEFHNKNYYKNKKIVADDAYINSLFKNIQNKVKDDSIFKIENVLVLLSSFVDSEESFIYIFDNYTKVIKKEIGNYSADLNLIEQSKVHTRVENINYILFTAYLNLQKKSKLKKSYLEEIKLFLEEILEIALDSKIFIYDNNFISFLQYLTDNYKDIADSKREKNRNILSLLKEKKYTFLKNMLGIFKSLYILGYEDSDFKDLQNTIKERLVNRKISENNYLEYNLDIENSIIDIYDNFKIDLGLDLIKNHHLENIEKNFEISHNIYISFQRVNFLIFQKILESKELEELNLKDKIVEVLKSAKKYFNSSFSETGKDFRYYFIEIVNFLILTKQIDFLEELSEDEREFLSDIYIIKNIFNYNYFTFEYQDELLKLLKISESKNILIQSLIWSFEGNKKEKIDNEEFYRLVSNQVEVYSKD